MYQKFRKLPIKKRPLFYLFSLVCLLLIAGSFTACGQDENPLRAFTTVQDLTGGDFTPIAAQDVPRNAFPNLSVPTYVTEVDGTYFIVDCYHNQIIYHNNLTDPLTDWQVLTSDIDKGHTIASDGTVYLADDTEGNRILVFEKKEGVFYHTQTLDAVGNRPHYIVYDAPTDTFYVWSSMSGEMYLCRHDSDSTQMYLAEIRKVDTLRETYVRSFTIDGNDIYFVSGIPGTPAILRADLSTFAVEETYPVPDALAGMIQLTFAEGDCYVTVSTDITGSQDYATIIRAKSLQDLADGAYEDIYEHFIGGGTPYYITRINNNYYLTEHRIPGHAVWKFNITENGISNVEPIY